MRRQAASAPSTCYDKYCLHLKRCEGHYNTILEDGCMSFPKTSQTKPESRQGSAAIEIILHQQVNRKGRSNRCKPFSSLSCLLAQLAVRLFRHRFKPFVRSIFAWNLKSQVGKPAIRCCPMPVLYVGRNVNDISR